MSISAHIDDLVVVCSGLGKEDTHNRCLDLFLNAEAWQNSTVFLLSMGSGSGLTQEEHVQAILTDPLASLQNI
jgi:hypothetical protein